MNPVLLALALAASTQAATPQAAPPIARAEFNRMAAEQGLPLFWVSDDDGAPTPGEMVVLRSDSTTAWITDGSFTPAFANAWNLVKDGLRRERVRAELSMGRTTLLRTDLRNLPEAERAFVRHMLRVADLIDQLYRIQVGAEGYVERLPTMDPESRALFLRNQGPWCVAPLTGSDPLCGALPELPPRRWATWPEGANDEICSAARQGPPFGDPFTVVRSNGGTLVASSYHDAWGPQMDTVALELEAASLALAKTPEKALRKYLLAAAQGFRANSWARADEAWAAMDARNSRWYLRVAPDESYWDLCQVKAGFGMTLAIQDPGSLKWQEALDPIKGEMESRLAGLIGAPYKARKVSFHMPDFIRVALYAGEAHAPLEPTLGQSLPNWGRVAEQNRGRTVVMTNVGTDPDTRAVDRQIAELVLVPESVRLLPVGDDEGLLDTLLHEATHNLGPATTDSQGRKLEDVMGGPLGSVLEETKAQAGGMWLVGLLHEKGLVDEAFVQRIHTGSVLWALNKVSQGMTDADGSPNTYSQVAAIIVGALAEDGALVWEEAPAAAGRTLPRFRLDHTRCDASIQGLVQKVGRVLANGDAQAGQALVDRYVSGPGTAAIHMEEITERISGFPKISLVYAVEP